jgi:ABC-type Co2+ transport system permease subunit
MKVLTALATFNFHVPFHIGLSALRCEHSACPLMEISLARWYALDTVKIPVAVPLHFKVLGLLVLLIGIESIAFASSFEKIYI